MSSKLNIVGLYQPLSLAKFASVNHCCCYWCSLKCGPILCSLKCGPVISVDKYILKSAADY